MKKATLTAAPIIFLTAGIVVIYPNVAHQPLSDMQRVSIGSQTAAAAFANSAIPDSDPMNSDGAIQVTPTFCPADQLTGTTPNDTCVQAAVNYACAPANSDSGNIAGELVFGRGKYYLHHITIPKACAGLRIVGQGYGNSPSTDNGTWIITDNTCSGPIFDFYPDATANLCSQVARSATWVSSTIS